MKKSPLVSIIMPSYNRADKLSRSITSVLKQSYQNWELIIIDDNSTDNTKDIVLKYHSKDNRIKYMANHRKKGPSGARNTGLLSAKGEYLAFLDSDDEYFSNHLEDSVSTLEHENQKIAFSLWIQEQEGRFIKYDETPGWRDSLNHAIEVLGLKTRQNVTLFNDNFYEYNIHHPFHCYCICTMVFHRDLLNTIGLFNEKIFGGEDTDFMYRAFLQHNFCLINNHHFIYYQGNDNLFNFIDWGKLDIDEIIGNKSLIKRIIFNMKHEITVRKLRQHQIKSSNKLKNKKSCLKANREILAQGYEILAYVYSQINRIKQLYYCAKCFFAGFRFKDLLSSINRWHPKPKNLSQQSRQPSLMIRNDMHVQNQKKNKKIILNTLS